MNPVHGRRFFYGSGVLMVAMIYEWRDFLEGLYKTGIRYNRSTLANTDYVPIE